MESTIQNSVGGRILARLKRPTGGLIAEIDGLRLIAIGAVIMAHIRARITFWIPASTEHMGLFQRTVDQGYFGVMLFFVLSGFILSLPFAEHALAGGQKVDLKFYFVRRVVRIEPPYILNLIFFTILAMLFLGHSFKEAIPHLLASLVYLHNLIFLQTDKDFTINGVAWSLEVEVQFYILAPLMCAVYFIRSTKLRRGLMLGAMAVSALSSQLLLSASPVARLSILGYIDYFLAGLLLADIYVLSWKGRVKASMAADLIGIAVAAGLLAALWASPKMAMNARNQPGIHWSVLAPFLVFLFYACVFRGRSLNALITNRWVVVTGGMCYSFYLYHQFVISAMFSKGTMRFYNPRMPYSVNFLVQCALILPVVSMVCVFFYLFFEQPFMRKGLQRRALAILSGVRVRHQPDESAQVGLRPEAKSHATIAGSTVSIAND
jgi:peptidoglycan/LPS O-acetylase OafA/YrhL